MLIQSYFEGQSHGMLRSTQLDRKVLSRLPLHSKWRRRNCRKFDHTPNKTVLVNDGRIAAGFRFFCSLPMEMWASNETTWPEKVEDLDCNYHQLFTILIINMAE